MKKRTSPISSEELVFLSDHIDTDVPKGTIDRVDEILDALSQHLFGRPFERTREMIHNAQRKQPNASLD